MQVLAYRKHFLLLSAAVVILPLSYRALDGMPFGDIRGVAILALPGTLHASAIVLSLWRRATVARSLFFIAFAAILNLAAPFSGMFASPLFPVVPVIVRLFPQLREIGDSTPGDSIKLLLVVSCASACGSLAYWFLIRALWWKSLGYRDLCLTLALCVTATLLAFVGFMLVGSIQAHYQSARDLYEILPYVLWWFAFSLSLYLSDPQNEEDKGGVVSRFIRRRHKT